MIKIIESTISSDFIWDDKWVIPVGASQPMKNYYPKRGTLSSTEYNSLIGRSLIGAIYKPGDYGDGYNSTYGADIYDNNIADTLDEAQFDTEAEAKAWVEDKIKRYLKSRQVTESTSTNNDAIVYGYVTTYKIQEDESDGKYHIYQITKNKNYKESNPARTYSSIEMAKKAIANAEKAYVKAKPNTPVANKDIWADHGVLWVDSITGNYYKG